MRFCKIASLLTVAALAVSCAPGSDPVAPERFVSDLSVPGRPGEASTEIPSSTTSTQESNLVVPADAEPARNTPWSGSWDVTFSLFTGDHHRVVDGTGYVDIAEDGTCSMQAQVRHGAFHAGGSGWFENVTAVFDRFGVLALSRTGTPGASSAPTQLEEIWRIDPPSMTPSDLVLSPADLHRWPPRVLCALPDVPMTGGSWDVPSAVASGERDRIESFARVYPTRPECYAVWSSVLDAAADHRWNESRFTEETIEVTRSASGSVTVLLRNDARFSVLRLELTPAPSRLVALPQAAASQALSRAASVDADASCEAIASLLFTR